MEPSDSKPDISEALRQMLPDSGAAIVEEEILIEIDHKRAKQNAKRGDQRTLARFFGFMLVMLGLLNLIPVAYFLIVLANEGQTQPIPRWIYFLGFVGAVHFLYATYVVQLVDFSALQMISLFLLVTTCIFGFVGMSLFLEGRGASDVVRYLQIAQVLKYRATVWSGIVFGLTALCCYLVGREALLWRQRHSVRINPDV